MSITAPRAAILATGAAALLGAPASAQATRDTVLNVLVECAKIDDPTARLACYDNNIKNAGGVVRSTVPGRVRVQGGGAPLANNEGPAGFGRENLPNADRSQGGGARIASIRPKVTAVSTIRAGIYVVTIEDGAQWQFSEGTPQSYRAPKVGSIVEIERGSLGSFLMRVDGQEGIRVRRIR